MVIPLSGHQRLGHWQWRRRKVSLLPRLEWRSLGMPSGVLEDKFPKIARWLLYAHL